MVWLDPDAFPDRKIIGVFVAEILKDFRSRHLNLKLERRAGFFFANVTFV